MLVEGLFQEIRVPNRNSTVRKGGTSQFAEECSLKTGHFVLQILCLLAKGTFRGVRPDTLDSIPDALDFVFETVTDDREIGRQGTVVVDKKDIFEALSSVTTGKLSNDLGTDGHPEMIDAVRSADFFSVVEWRFRIAIGDDENVLGWENL
jgi:hypothetical protein